MFWEMLNGTLLAFDKESMSTYLERTWTVVQQEVNIDEIVKYTYPHVCSALMVQLLILMLRGKTNDVGLRTFILFSMGLLINTNSI